MRHRVAVYKLNRSKGHRSALRRTLIKQLFEHERILTTRAKAMAIRGEAEKVITLAKRGNEAEEAEIPAQIAARAAELEAEVRGGPPGSARDQEPDESQQKKQTDLPSHHNLPLTALRARREN